MSKSMPFKGKHTRTHCQDRNCRLWSACEGKNHFQTVIIINMKRNYKLTKCSVPRTTCYIYFYSFLFVVVVIKLMMLTCHVQFSMEIIFVFKCSVFPFSCSVLGERKDQKTISIDRLLPFDSTTVNHFHWLFPNRSKCCRLEMSCFSFSLPTTTAFIIIVITTIISSITKKESRHIVNHIHIHMPQKINAKKYHANINSRINWTT